MKQEFSQGRDRYLNRERSWLKFNERVLAEAENERNPILERIKFLSIFESNLDEFYMVRVSGLIEQVASGYKDRTPDGMTAQEQLELISEMVRPMRSLASHIWEGQLKPKLEDAEIKIVAFSDLSGSEQLEMTRYFESEVFPLCTPLMMSPTVTFPFISNRSLNLAIELGDDSEFRLARVKIPTGVPRAVPIPGEKHRFIMLEELIVQHLNLLFPGVEIGESHLFRVVRDADIEIRELEAADLISAVEQTLRLRRYGDPVFLEVKGEMPEHWIELLMTGLELDSIDVFKVEGQLGMDFLWEFTSLNMPEHQFKVHHPVRHEAIRTWDGLLEQIRLRDVLIHTPYDSFDSVETFVQSSAVDPHVIGVKQTLYRVGSESPIVENLLAAAEAGKQVAVMVELKARFDESNNLVWARALERAGVHVSYGMIDKKVHCKLCLVVRKESSGIKSYVHIGTGNYNPSTSRIYTDIGLFTDDEDIVQDVTELFNYLTGYSRQMSYRKLLVAPHNLRERILELIEQEIGFHSESGKGKISIKVNSLVDPEVIDALYSASQAGVEVNLVVRGICCLRPGVKGLSDNIRVVSVVGRFLEHSRIYVFDRGGSAPMAYIGSADMMRRNLDKRIEVLVPVEEQDQIEYLRDIVIGYAMKDNMQGWKGEPDGDYSRLSSGASDSFSSQFQLISQPASLLLENVSQSFQV